MNLKSSFFSFQGKTTGKIYFYRIMALAFVVAILAVIISQFLSTELNQIFLAGIEIIYAVGVPFLFFTQDYQRLNALKPNLKEKKNYLVFLGVICFTNIMSNWFDVFDEPGFRYLTLGITLYLIFANAEYDSVEEKERADKF